MGGRSRRSGVAPAPLDRAARAAERPPFIVLTGLSGLGKSQAIRALEDLGYFCVDNLPTTLIPTLARAVAARRRRHREGRDRRRRPRGRLPVVVPEGLPAAAEDAAAQPGADLPRGEPRRAGAALQRDAAAASAGAGSVGQRRHPRRARAAERRSATMADEIVDTSDMTVHELRQFFMGLSRDRARAPARRHAPQLRLQARRAGRRRPRVRRALPAEPAFRAGAAAAGPAATARSSTFMERDASTREFIGPARGLPAVRRAVLRRGRQELPDDRDRLHRRPAPLGDDRRALRKALGGTAGRAACASAIATWQRDEPTVA